MSASRLMGAPFIREVDEWDLAHRAINMFVIHAGNLLLLCRSGRAKLNPRRLFLAARKRPHIQPALPFEVDGEHTHLGSDPLLLVGEPSKLILALLWHRHSL